MPIIAKKSEGKDFPLPTAGTTQAVCYDVWELGVEKGNYKGKDTFQFKIRIAWELNEIINSEDKWNGTRFKVSKKYTLSLNEGARLYKDLIAWRGKEFTEEEIKGFNVENVIGTNCLLTIIHYEYEGKPKARVNGVTSLPRGMSPLLPESPRGIPDWIAKIQGQAVQADEEQSTIPTDANGVEIPF